MWLPILVSAVAVLIVSNILWMALPFWHRADYGKLSDERPILDAVGGVASGAVHRAVRELVKTPSRRT